MLQHVDDVPFFRQSLPSKLKFMIFINPTLATRAFSTKTEAATAESSQGVLSQITTVIGGEFLAILDMSLQ
jgi:hypothetical protein